MEKIGDKLTVLLRILTSEQQIIQRTDTKATALLSSLGVFMVFFIVHFDKIKANHISIVLVILYFVAAMLTIISLLLVIRPKIVTIPNQGNENTVNPTFFAGIAQFADPVEYAKYLIAITDKDERIFTLFSQQVFAVAKINASKNKWLKRGLVSFVTAIIFELSGIIVVYLDFVF